ncbi:MAG: endonuclease domain-containing protein [Candidatus Kaiserbacteria bacterium]|nr:endonuclease domain-containing protein [Candidatus Kaiserbacteria bacterium]
MVTCLVCNKGFKRLGGHVIDAHKMTSKQYYDKFLKLEGEGCCLMCGKETKFSASYKRAKRKGYDRFCSISCSTKLQWKTDESFRKIVTDIFKQSVHEYWKNPENIKKARIRGKECIVLMYNRLNENDLNGLMNKKEERLLKLLPDDFEFVGNFKKVIAFMSPDFISEDRKKIVELYGDYWHKDESIEKTQHRIDIFKSFGYDTLIIWEKELKSSDVKRKIEEFLK